MTPEMVTAIGRETVEVILLVSAPVLLAGMAVGLVISVFQAVTQIQEMTLSFVPKLIVVFAVLIGLSPWLMEVMITYTSGIFTNIPNYIK
ncbi:MAG: flagellar biosynthesis protein FliQ [Deltaproteobacteria bacterium]